MNFFKAMMGSTVIEQNTGKEKISSLFPPTPTSAPLDKFL